MSGLKKQRKRGTTTSVPKNETKYTPEKSSGGFIIKVFAPDLTKAPNGVFLMNVPLRGQAYMVVHPLDYENVISNMHLRVKNDSV